MKWSCSVSAWVDSADAGRYAEASFFSTPISFPARAPVSAITITQKASTAHLVRRPLGRPAMRCAQR